MQPEACYGGSQWAAFLNFVKNFFKKPQHACLTSPLTRPFVWLFWECHFLTFGWSFWTHRLTSLVTVINRSEETFLFIHQLLHLKYLWWSWKTAPLCLNPPFTPIHDWLTFWILREGCSLVSKVEEPFPHHSHKWKHMHWLKIKINRGGGGCLAKAGGRRRKRPEPQESKPQGFWQGLFNCAVFLPSWEYAMHPCARAHTQHAAHTQWIQRTNF